ncbi:hypothetical protein D3C86_2150130 [compost metagenome]
MDKLRLLVIILCVEIPLYKSVPEYEKDHLVDAMVGDRGYICILRKAFVRCFLGRRNRCHRRIHADLY